MNGFSEKRYFVKMKNGEVRYFPTQQAKETFESLNDRMKQLDKYSEKKTGSPFPKGKNS